MKRILGGSLLAAFAAFGASRMQDAPPATPIKLARVYEAAETQAYTAQVAIKPAAAQDEEFKADVEFTAKVAQIMPGGGAKAEISFKKIKMSFGGQEMPAGDLPKDVTKEFDQFGLPKQIDTDDENPVSFLFPAYFVPNKELAIGATFPITWASDDGNMKLDGEGKLLATGMLFEEHVAKLSLTVQAKPKDDSPGKFQITTFINSKTGKLVKAEGSLESDDASMGGDFKATFTISKVRSK